MAKRKDAREVFEDLKRRLQGDEAATARVGMRYLVSGGAPGQRLELEYRVERTSELVLRREDQKRADASRERRLRASSRIRRLWLQRLAGVAARAMPVEEAAFLPDSMVGVLEVEESGEATQLYFRPDVGALRGLVDQDFEEDAQLEALADVLSSAVQIAEEE